MSRSMMKLGRKPARHDPRVPRLASLMRAASLPKPPPTVLRPQITRWIMGQNDQYGDCTVVARANAILCLTTLAGQPVRLSDDAVLQSYWHLTGGADTGLYEQDVLQDWQHEGVATGATAPDLLDAFMQVQTENRLDVQQAIALFGGLYAGAELPLTAQDQTTEWDVVPSAPAAQQALGSWGGHAFFVPEYNSAGPIAISWGQRIQITWRWWDRYVDEAFALADKDFLQAGTTPTGLGWDQLRSSLNALRE